MLFWNINIRIPCMNLCLQSPDDLFETISQALMNAFDRDAVSGWGAVVYIMWVGLLVFKWQCWLFQIVLSYLTVCKEFAPIPETPGAPPLSADTIGWFSEAGLLEWMCFVIFRARGCSTLPGRFLSRHCFTLCITVEVEPRIVKQYCCSCKNYRGKGMEGVKKKCALFFGWPEDHEFVEEMRFGASYSTRNKLLLIARHIMTTGLQKCL